METRANYALIGALVLIATAAIAGFILWLGGSQLSQDYKSYDIVFEGPVSLEEGAAVRYIGIKVGEVSWVRIDRADPSKVRARVRIDRETPVKQDSKATIELAGITGTTFVQLTAGTAEALALEARAGQPVPVILSERTQLAELFSGGTDILDNAGQAVEKINSLLTDENIASLNTTIQNIETITTEFAKPSGLISQASRTMTDVSEASVAFETASASLNEFGETADGRIAAFGDQMDVLMVDLQSMARNADLSVRESTKAITAATSVIEGPAAGAIDNASLASEDLRMLINRLDRIAREVERNPQSLVRGNPVPYEESR
jgi:phospholipid/cholesterol/gamma-HCH transport system substrate-binding protein